MENNTSTFILQKIESVESRLESHVSKIEARLDQLVNLMQAVAALQERESRNADTILELKSSLRDSVDKFDKSIERLHTRYDKDSEDNKILIDKMFEAQRNLKDNINSTDEKVEKWTNRGIGLWIGISGVVVILQTMGGLFVNSIKNEYDMTKATVAEMAKKQLETDRELDRIKHQLTK